MRSYAALFTFLALIVSAAAPAWARPTVALHLTASVVHRESDGTVKLTSANGVTLKPADVVRYEIVATNTGDAPAEGVRPLDHIPAGTAYVAGSERGPGKVEFSLDQGKTWAAVPMVVVHDKDGDHTVKADPATFTTIRWTTPGALKAGATERFHFDVVVK